MYKKAKQTLSQLPPEYQTELLPDIRREFLQSTKTVVVFDDDPTGTQTCYDVVVLTSWSVAAIAEELKKKPSILFILTNSRSLSGSEAVELTNEVGINLKKACEQTGRDVVVISRSDSTLRGHFPGEVSAIARSLHMEQAIWVLVPAFIEGGRFTIDDVHYIVEQNELVPVSETPFAQDKSFGYNHSNVREWVEEKTAGAVEASDVVSISIEEIRSRGPESVSRKLSACRPGQVVLVNAASYKDLEVFAMGLIAAERAGKKFLLRSSATFVSIRAGIAPGKILKLSGVQKADRGSLIVVGSYVPKTTSQLDHLLAQGKHEAMEISVAEIIASWENSIASDAVSKKIDEWLGKGRDVVIYTSRQLEAGIDSESSLRINRAVSDFLVHVISQLTVRPSFFIAKGGITSSDLASKALIAGKALILGQAIPGVPVWELDEKSKFPKILYIVFPGNVGGASALWEVWYRFKYNI